MVSVLLWDFGDTICDQRFMRQNPAARSDGHRWTPAWNAAMGALGADWDIGRCTKHEIFAFVAADLGWSTDDVATHAKWCCEHIDFYDNIFRIVHERRLTQVLVTVNTDIVNEWVVPCYGLDSVFDAIVNSCDEGTVDKGILCLEALERIGHTGPPSDALLIDNMGHNVVAWEQEGGTGYHFVGDEAFLADLPGLIGLAQRIDVGPDTLSFDATSLDATSWGAV